MVHLSWGAALLTLSVAIAVYLINSFIKTIKSYKTPPNVSQTRFLPKGSVKKIAIIGSGSSGIAAAKEALASGFDVTILEQSGDIGGNWVFKENEAHSSVYKSTFINTSKQIMTYSDFPMPPEYPTYPHHKQIVHYFREYAKHFNVLPHIQFHTQVLSVEPENEADMIEQQKNTSGNWDLSKCRWKITYQSHSDGNPLYMKNLDPKSVQNLPNVQTEIFDAVVICSGHHSVPKMPDPPIPGLETFPGNVIHSHSYKDPTSGYNYTDKRVVVVGIGNSAVDIANELSRCAHQVYLSTRTGAWILPKYLFGKPIDHFGGLPRLVLMIPLPIQFLTTLLFKFLEIALSLSQGKMSYWNLDPKCRVWQTHPTVSHELLHRIGNGTIRVKPDIASINGDVITFRDQSTVQADALIFCTGYKIKYHFLDHKWLPITEQNEVTLYKYMFSPNLPPTLSVIGLIQPLGAIMPIAEIQSRWVMEVLKGDVGLPTRSEMEEDITFKKDEMKARYLQRSRHTIQVDGALYMEEIAKQFGVVPKIKNHPALWKELLFEPVLPFQYRLDGPGAWDGAEEALKKTIDSMKHGKAEQEAGIMWD